MVVGMLTILGVYGLCILLLHLIYWGCRGKTDKPFAYVLVTKNNQLQIEWYLRMLLFFSALKGRTVQIIILDEGSSDDTLSIVQRFTRKYAREIQVFVAGPESIRTEDFIRYTEGQRYFVLQLSDKKELVEIPLY